MISKTTLVFEGQFGDLAKVVVSGVASLAAADVLAADIAGMSDGALKSRSFADEDLTSEVPGTGSNTDYRGIAYFQRVDTGNTVRLTIPAIKAIYVEDVPGRNNGQRMTAAAMGSINSALMVATGKVFRNLYGVVLQVK